MSAYSRLTTLYKFDFFMFAFPFHWKSWALTFNINILSDVLQPFTIRGNGIQCRKHAVCVCSVQDFIICCHLKKSIAKRSIYLKKDIIKWIFLHVNVMERNNKNPRKVMSWHVDHWGPSISKLHITIL